MGTKNCNMICRLDKVDIQLFAVQVRGLALYLETRCKFGWLWLNLYKCKSNATWAVESQELFHIVVDIDARKNAYFLYSFNIEGTIYHTFNTYFANHGLKLGSTVLRCAWVKPRLTYNLNQVEVAGSRLHGHDKQQAPSFFAVPPPQKSSVFVIPHWFLLDGDLRMSDVHPFMHLSIQSNFSEVLELISFKLGTVTRYIYHGGLMRVKQNLAKYQNMALMDVFCLILRSLYHST